NEAPDIVPESPAWQAWLDSISSFGFHGKMGYYRLRKERKERGESSWYAYVPVKGKVVKRHLGPSSNLTLARLEQVAEKLAPSQEAEGGHEETLLGSRPPSSPSGRGSARTASTKATSSARAQSPPVPLITTKVQAPRLRSALVHRSRLIQRLQEGMKGPL